LISDGRTIPANSQLTADLCIIGAGAAGITLALQLADTPTSVIVLESGGFLPETAVQDLARGEVGGLGYVPLDTARLRCFGGSTMHWGGWCRPLDPLDFEARSWVPHSGWPITRATVEPYYPRAQELCQVGDFSYDPADWDLPKDSLLPLPPDRIRSRLIQFSPPTRFGVRYREPIEKAKNISVYLNSNVTQILPSPNGSSITSLRVATLTKNQFSVKARRYVLAAGGIENPRLLLASNEVLKAGVGNDHDLIGRFFADHMQLDTMGLFPTSDQLSFELYLTSSREVSRRSRRPQGRPANVMAYLTLDPRVQEARRTVNWSADVFATTWSEYFAATETAGGVERSMWENITHSLSNLWENLDEAVGSAFRSDAHSRRMFKVVTTQEQTPNPASRVTLAHDRDALGTPRARLEWQLTELDRHSIEVAADELTRAFGATGVAKVHVPGGLHTRAWPSNIPISWHHCGTTRMSDDPKRGVVNADLRVHGIDNLYISGSSVFPTNGNGNPTLTIVALTLRLADHLKAAAT
jgi:choline dehydrogenase-like flavoprotein